MRFVLAAGSTRTARIDGLSAAGADPALRAHTPSADADILAFGQPITADVVPVSPTGCPTPAIATRAARELVGFPVTVLEAGLAKPTAADTVDLGATPGDDIRKDVAVPDADAVGERAFDHARETAPAGRIYLAETIPGGTTTAMGVLRALGEPGGVSSSLPDNPIERKRAVVEQGLTASGLEPGDAAGEPRRAIRAMGDPVLAALLGYARGAFDADTSVTLAGGTQLLAVAACLRHAGVDADVDLATTVFLRRDSSADVDRLARRLEVAIRDTDPGFDDIDHPATAAYGRGEAKEGVGMGGALDVVARSETPLSALGNRFVQLTDELTTGQPSRVAERA